MKNHKKLFVFVVLVINILIVLTRARAMFPREAIRIKRGGGGPYKGYRKYFDNFEEPAVQVTSDILQYQQSAKVLQSAAGSKGDHSNWVPSVSPHIPPTTPDIWLQALLTNANNLDPEPDYHHAESPYLPSSFISENDALSSAFSRDLPSSKDASISQRRHTQIRSSPKHESGYYEASEISGNIDFENSLANNYKESYG